MKKVNLFILILLAAVAVLVSCGDEPDGKWDKMKWNAPSGLAKENGIYIVPAEGGTYTFECKNYSAPWLSGILDNGEYVYPHPGQEDVHSFTGDWFGVHCDHANVTITIQPLDGSTSSRSLNVGVTAGDIFDSINFLQRQ